MRKTAGFTIVEILIAIVIIGIMLGLVIGALPESRASSRNKARAADIDALQSSLEQYFSDHGGYPRQVDTTNLPKLDPDNLADPDGQDLVNKDPVSSQYAAVHASDPTADGPNYSYTAFPTNCSSGLCTGYVLKSYMEQTDGGLSNPYIRTGLNNN